MIYHSLNLYVLGEAYAKSPLMYLLTRSSLVLRDYRSPTNVSQQNYNFPIQWLIAYDKLNATKTFMRNYRSHIDTSYKIVQWLSATNYHTHEYSLSYKWIVNGIHALNLNLSLPTPTEMVYSCIYFSVFEYIKQHWYNANCEISFLTPSFYNRL